MHQHKSDRAILVSALGLTPQVVTETLYCLMVERKPPVAISEIHIITTASGKKKVLKRLLANGKGKFYEFCKEYGLKSDEIKFDQSMIYTLTNSKGKELDDIRTVQDNENAANQIVSHIRRLTSDPQTTLYCSVAGGRKTMGVYLAFALSLFGRPQDTLSHVLVSPTELESHSGFFYKPKTNRRLEVIPSHGPLRNYVNTEAARIELAEIPYIRLREHMETIFGRRDIRYSEMVKLAQKEVDTFLVPGLTLEKASCLVSIGKKKVVLQPVEFVVYMYFARLKGRKTIDQLSAQALQKVYGSLCRQRGIREPRRPAFSPENLRTIISRINRGIKAALPDPLLNRYYVISPPVKGWYKGHGIALDKSKVNIV